MLAKIRFYFLSTAFLSAFIALSKTERGQPMFKRIWPSPPGPKILPSFNAKSSFVFEQVYEFLLT